MIFQTVQELSCDRQTDTQTDTTENTTTLAVWVVISVLNAQSGFYVVISYSLHAGVHVQL